MIFGSTNQAGEDSRNVARFAALLAGMPVTVPGQTVNRLCASGLGAVIDSARAITAGEGDVYIAGGVESMSRAPLYWRKQKQPFRVMQKCMTPPSEPVSRTVNLPLNLAHTACQKPVTM